MNTTTAPTTIDLGDLLAFRDEIASDLPGLIHRISNDDQAAIAEAIELIAREDKLVGAIVEAVVGLLPACSRWDAEDQIRDAVMELTIAGDLYEAVDRYADRRVENAVTRHIAAFATAIQSDPDARPFAEVIAAEVIRHAASLMRSAPPAN